MDLLRFFTGNILGDSVDRGIRGFFEWADPYQDRIINKHIQQLQNEPWFRELFADIGYSQIINQHKGIREILFREKAVELLQTDEVFRSKFKKAIIEEFNKSRNGKREG